MEKEVEFVNRDYYFKKEPDNEFFNYSTHGLNFEGIKKYYSIPTNTKYHHMIRVRNDLEKLIEDSKIKEKERKIKYDRDNVYTDERLYKMYASNKEKKNDDSSKPHYDTLYKFDDNLKNVKLFNKIETTNKPIELKIKENNINKRDSKQKMENSFNKKEINFSNINNDNSIRNKIFSKFKVNNRRKNLSLSLNKKKNRNTLNTLYNLRKFKSNEFKDLPMIKPRKIIIETHLVNDCGVDKEDKRFGHNSYMGGSYNPFNYYTTTRNRTKRNVYGSLFLN